MYLRNGQPFDINASFQFNGQTYSPGIARAATVEQRAAWGITEVPDPIMPNPKFYWVTQTSGGALNITPRDLTQIKDTMIAEVKNTAATMLAPTDWKFVREAETGIPVDDRTRLFRAAIRVRANELEDDINDCTDVGMIEALPISWPSTSDSPTLSDAISGRIRAAWDHMFKKLEGGSVSVTISAGTYPFSTDKEARENIMGVNTAIAVGLPVDNPRNWTPKGALSPVLCTHTDLALIGGSLLAAKDAYLNIYFAHKAAISALSTVDAVIAYDFTAGYPA